MTDETMSLRDLLEKTADTDFLREMIGFTARRLMELEVESLTGAPHGTRTPDRFTQRNGYRERDWRPVPEPSNCVFQSSARAATSQASSSRGEWPRRRSPQ